MVGYVDTHDNMKDFDEKFAGKDAGPYVGTVKFTNDPLRQGRLGVNIPELSLTNDPGPSDCIWCQYLSPFYGAKSVEANDKSDPDSYKGTQHTYGMWFVPPDIDTQVLVIFAKGETSKKSAFWIGCVQQPLTNQQVPGYGSSSDTIRSKQDNRELNMPGQTGQTNYGTDFLPVGEKNRKIIEEAQTEAFANSLQYPINDVLADQLLGQGLVQDTVRGTTSSSARREAPSQVFGVNTPGRIREDSRTKNIGPEGAQVRPDRNPGHSFVMDDGAEDGTNQLTRIRTASGHQLLMHDTQGVVYIANGSGNAYIEMQTNGRIDVYSGVGGINLRTEGDFNLHSDSNINMHANGQIRMSAAKEMIHSADAILHIGDRAILNSSPEGAIREYAKDGISSFTKGLQLHGAKGQIHLAGQQVHLNSVNASDQWGPAWLTAEKVGLNLREEGDVELAQKGLKPLQEFTRKTKTTVHRFVTHEPMFRANVITNDSVIPIDEDKKKQWSKKAKIPGTPEFVNQQNRLSENSAIRDAQYQADALAYVKQKIGESTNGSKARELLTEFGLKYNEIYGINEKINLPFDIKDSITEKIKGIEFNSDVKNLTKTITSQVVEKFTGKSTELFKDNVFVNQQGKLFTLSNTATSNIDAVNRALNSVDGLKKNLSSGNVVGTIANLNSITQNYSSVIGGKIVGINSITKLAQKTGLYNASAARLGNQTFLQNVGQNIQTQLGNIGGQVRNFFSGFKFSDRRLKEDIRCIGRSPSGINIYSFKYCQIPGRYIGVMAQEVPWATHMTDTGYYAVDYSKVDVEFRRLH